MMDVDQAARIIRNGGVIAYPTEAVWGLGCDPWNQQAVYRILDIKQRPVAKGVILIGASEDQFAPLLNPLSCEERARLKSTWPGPYTWLIPDPAGWAPDWVRGQFDTVAVRITAHPLVKTLCEATGHPIVSTSANLAGKDPLLTFSGVEEVFGSLLDGIVPGETGEQKTPSKIQDLRSGQLVRAG
ncbi:MULTISPECIES: L-threonylcarbamoyladenylate synthase [unclassified Endozoicomonas]|uniref:L-threonylcarbamoyladenylate synthase n=1 Tax=unclassified Endozoicomonas TaxID=2644528 RepID=UPI003BB57687